MGNARFEKQRERMRKILESGECPFCPSKLSLWHKMPILKETVYWMLTENEWPYPFTKLHLLLISKSHQENLRDMLPAQFLELRELLVSCEKIYGITSGVFACRFGDPKGNGGSVRHLHLHLIVPENDTKRAGYEPPRFRCGKKK